eukprot:TRINITY_DN2650_c0_g2_i1.p1 TRINITY_DN2650_c0_g2~~TRINITY_DN2650_c0_g2_i1.p1  ORF type:complete len:907 (+),score=336.26 TRINITY_DN2650_c0_g2_i1:150-2870(+)
MGTDVLAELHAAAAAGDVDAMERLLATGIDVDAQDADRCGALHVAAWHDRVAAVTYLLRKGADVHLKEAHGRTPLFAAACNGSVAAMEPLLEAVPDPCHPAQRDAEGACVLHAAAKYDRPDVTALLKPWAAGLLRITDKHKYTPLHTAAQYATHAVAAEMAQWDLALVRQLVQAEGGAEAQQKFVGFEDAPRPPNPAIIAAQGYDSRVLQILLDATERTFAAEGDGAPAEQTKEVFCATLGWRDVHWAVFRGAPLDVDMNPVDADGSGATALHLAAGLGRRDALDQLLVQSGDTKARRVEAAFTRLMKSVREDPARAKHLVHCAEETRDLISELSWDYSKCANAADSSGRTPLHVACQYAREECVTRLVEERADLDAADNFGWAPLHHAAERGDPNVISVLLASGANVNAQAHDGATAVTIAAAKGASEALALLLSCPTLVVGVAPMIAAVRNGQAKALRMICGKSQPETVVQPCAESEGGPLGYALTLGDIPAVEVLLSLSPALSNTLIVETLRSKKLLELKKKQILHFLLRRMKPDIKSVLVAACLGEDGCLEILLEADPAKINEYGAVDTRLLPEGGTFTPLQAALAANKRSTALALLGLGANPNIFYEGSMPVLVAAVTHCHDHVIKALLSNGASPNEAIALPSRQRVPIAPITTAVEQGMDTVCKWLYKKGADLECKQGGTPPLFVACREKRWELGRMFLSLGAAVNVFVDHPDLGEVGPLYYALRDATDRRCFQFFADLLESLAPPPQDNAVKMSEVRDTTFTVLQAACTRPTLLGVRALLSGAKAARMHPGFVFDGQCVYGLPEIQRIVIKYGAKVDCVVFVESQKRAQAVMWELTHSKKGNNHQFAAAPQPRSYSAAGKAGPMSPAQGGVRPTPPAAKRRALIIFRDEQDLRQFNCMY